jgi:hypothetical protein
MTLHPIVLKRKSLKEHKPIIGGELPGVSLYQQPVTFSRRKCPRCLEPQPQYKA